MDTIKIGKKRGEDGNIESTIRLFADDLSHYTGKDLIYEFNNSQSRQIDNSEIPLRIATIKQNVINIHETSNGKRDCECFLHLIRMINESGLLMHKIEQSLMNANIIVRGQSLKISGYIDTNKLAQYYETIFIADDDMREETSFIHERFYNAYKMGIENKMIDLYEEQKLFTDFQRELSHNESRKM